MRFEYLLIGVFLIIVGMIFISLSLLPIEINNNQLSSNEDNSSGSYSNSVQKVEKYGVEKDKEGDDKNIQFSGVIFIGPIPIVFGNSPMLMIISVLITIGMIIWIFLYYMSFINGGSVK